MPHLLQMHVIIHELKHVDILRSQIKIKYLPIYEDPLLHLIL